MVSAIATTSAATTSSNINISAKTSKEVATSKSEKFSSFINNFKKVNEKTSDTTNSESDTSNAKSDSNSKAEELVKEIKSTFKDVSTCPKCGAIYIGEAPPAICTKCGTSIEQHINGDTSDNKTNTNNSTTDSNTTTQDINTSDINVT